MYFATSALKTTVYVWCQKMFDGQKFVSNTELQSVVLEWHGQQPASFFSSGIQKFADRENKCLSKLG